jgi:hypothetical protein
MGPVWTIEGTLRYPFTQILQILTKYDKNDQMHLEHIQERNFLSEQIAKGLGGVGGGGNNLSLSLYIYIYVCTLLDIYLDFSR